MQLSLSSRPSTRVLRTALLALLVAALCVIPAIGQDFEPKRLSNGHPDLNGIWQSNNEANWNIELHMARAALQMREGPVIPVPAKEILSMGAVGSVPGGMGIVEGGKIPYKPEAREKQIENQANYLERDPEVKCYLPGIPRANYMPHPFQIFQNEHSMLMAYSYAGAVREIYMKDPGEAPIDTWMGQSYGKWDGDTLVIEVTGQHDQSWLDRAGNHHSDQMKVTERWTAISPDHIQYEATIEDPVVLTEPYKISMPLYRRIEENAQLMDFRCVEFVEELLFGEYRRNPLDR